MRSFKFHSQLIIACLLFRRWNCIMFPKVPEIKTSGRKVVWKWSRESPPALSSKIAKLRQGHKFFNSALTIKNDNGRR
jgi:hypothetical protein